MGKWLNRSSLPLVGLILGLSLIGALVTVSIGDYGSCTQASSFVYLRVVSGSSANIPIQGAKVDGNVQWFCAADTPSGYITQYSSVKSRATPDNGTVYLGTNSGNYSLSVQYQGQKYSVNFSPVAGEIFLVILNLPTGQVSSFSCALSSISECLNTTDTSPAGSN